MLKKIMYKNYLFQILLFFINPIWGFTQNIVFDNLNSIGSSKSINWTTSTWGGGFGHRIISMDPGEFTTLNFQARHNSSTWNNAMVLTSRGRVGFGLTDPLYSFHLLSSTGERSRFQFGSTIVDLVDYSSNTQGFSNSAGLFVIGKDALLMSDQGSNIRFVSNLSGPYVESMRIRPNGNVGIGTTNPNNKLEVNGTIKTREVNVSATGWPDYVFRPQYQLMPLEELEAFILNNGNLPNVPKEEDVMINGVNLSEMNVKLLEKVEELTLHLIMLNTKNKSLEKRILELEKKATFIP
jgi:hypothetical protein